MTASREAFCRRAESEVAHVQRIVGVRDAEIVRLNGICDMRRDTVVMRNNEIKRLTAEIARLHEHWDSVQRANTRKCTEIELLQANQAKALEALVRLYNAQNGPPSIRRQADWEDAMDLARGAIRLLEGKEAEHD